MNSACTRRTSTLPFAAGYETGRAGRFDKSDQFQGEGVILIFGLPRSGTTWLAKIFDSHPDVLYRHEPDIVDREPALPWVCAPGDIERYVELARTYLDRLIKVRTVKSAGPLPIFEKNYRTIVTHCWRATLLQAMRVVGSLASANDEKNGFPISDFLRTGCTPLHVVIKSVTSVARANLFSEAWPNTRTIVIMRHPCGQIASMVRGIRLGRFPQYRLPNDLASLAQALRHGLAAKDIQTFSPIEHLAWTWAIVNQKLSDELGNKSNVKLILYEDIATNPIEISRDLFQFVGLRWNSKTEDFLTKSKVDYDSGRYFGLRRNPEMTLSKWRQELSVEDQHLILSIAQDFPVGEFFL